MRKEMTDEEIAVARKNHQSHVFDLVNALHDGGFNRIAIESMQVGRDAYYTTVMLTETSLGIDQFSTACEIAIEKGAHTHLRQDRPSDLPRIAFSVYREEAS